MLSCHFNCYLIFIFFPLSLSVCLDLFSLSHFATQISNFAFRYSSRWIKATTLLQWNFRIDCGWYTIVCIAKCRIKFTGTFFIHQFEFPMLIEMFTFHFITLCFLRCENKLGDDTIELWSSYSNIIGSSTKWKVARFIASWLCCRWLYGTRSSS